MLASFCRLLVRIWDAPLSNLGLKTNFILEFRAFPQSHQKYATIVFKLHQVRFASYYLEMSNHPTP